MDPVSAIVGALIAGATAAASETAATAVKDAYQGLKAVLVDGYKLLSASLLEKKPTSAAYREAVADEVKAEPRIADDPTVLERAKAVHDALRQERPETLSALGIDIRELEAGGNLIVERIQGGVRGDKWTAENDVRLSDISVSGSLGKR